MKRLVWCAAVVLAALGAGRRAAAQDVASDVAELKARVHALERQNVELQQKLLERLPPIQEETTLPTSTRAYHHLNEIFLENLVEQRIAEYEARRRAEEGANGQSGQNGENGENGEQEEDPWHEVGSDLSLSASWNHGVELQSKHKDFRLHVGGRTQFDTSWYSVDQAVQSDPRIINPYEDGVDFRRARFRMDGTMYEWIEWAAEYDFMQSFRLNGVDRALTAPTDLWFGFKEVPFVGNVRIGNHKPAVGFEHLVSSRFLPFMERSYNQDTFYGGRYNGFQPGISVFDTYDDEMGTWNLGLYKPTDNVFAYSANTGDYMAVARLTRLLWYVEEGRGLLHIGASGVQQSTVDDRYIFRTRDAIRAGIADTWPVPASTGLIAGDDMQWINAELVAVYGPWTFQSEWLVSGMQDAAPIVGGVVQPSVGTVTYHGGYAQILYFLTGESDRYNRKTGAFDRVIPYENAYIVRDPCGNHCCGLGAWQVGVRYNYLDLNDNGINGGILHNLTLGINWFLNPNMKIQANYIATHRDAPGFGDGWINGWGARVAHDF